MVHDDPKLKVADTSHDEGASVGSFVGAVVEGEGEDEGEGVREEVEGVAQLVP